MALKQNPEGLFDCPGFSKKGKEVQSLLECIFKINGLDTNAMYYNSTPLITFLMKHDSENL